MVSLNSLTMTSTVSSHYEKCLNLVSSFYIENPLYPLSTPCWETRNRTPPTDIPKNLFVYPRSSSLSPVGIPLHESEGGRRIGQKKFCWEHFFVVLGIPSLFISVLTSFLCCYRRRDEHETFLGWIGHKSCFFFYIFFFSKDIPKIICVRYKKFLHFPEVATQTSFFSGCRMPICDMERREEEVEEEEEEEKEEKEEEEEEEELLLLVPNDK